MRRLLVTGGAGILGRALAERGIAGWRLRSLARSHPADYPADAETVEGDLCDPQAVRRAVAGCDAVLHLACRYADDIGFAETLAVNYHATLDLMEAAAEAGIRNVVFASSNHVQGFFPRSAAPLSETAQVRPDGWYGVSKIWGEAVMALYADTRGMTTTSLRIGSSCAQVMDERQFHMWLGFDDFAQLVRLSIERQGPGHAVLNAVGDCEGAFFDNSRAKAMGYAPRQNPRDHLSDPSIPGAAPQGGIFGRSLGGGFARANFKADLELWENTP
ncbi:NAD-dependent epimerase/dehydratase family protein [Paracoccus thiocyanatus]|uniref:NAD-dependent dehydratase n=1 Tax=Paracoccus thiocyanatus TaxID=34006 RepID=A0A3D8PHS4_9RHOB|nr:NAD(P)-dependent oxidoreductase [Paracoccus thiocyanatus]RDW14735.1 NAD-dependent dehydratase [Paracoccus thiocyanatus]